ncbi:MAG: hypothetical protein RMX96_32285 [Nostoc sp. ChiSLP02]|nr:hypothetical protein [Nostoc sp. DedSLP05]MDZ8097681.1 hypothetical protein [Nostoc sp. DedSLP01]MDZ8189504.1 hypothetical protein [Nostoc sp. ChiSLP02]
MSAYLLFRYVFSKCRFGSIDLTKIKRSPQKNSLQKLLVDRSGVDVATYTKSTIETVHQITEL